MADKKEKRLPILGERLNTLRGDLSQVEFAKRVGLTAATVGYYENSVRLPDAETIRKICVACNCTSDYLLGLEPSPSHTTSDVCRETGLPPEPVEVLKLYATAAANNAEWAKFFNDFGENGEPLPQTTTELGLKALSHLIANCNELLTTIGLYWFGEFTGFKSAKVEGISITLKEPGEFIRNGLLQTATLALSNYRKNLQENGGDLPLTWVLDATKADRKAAFVKQRVEWLEQQRGRALTEEEIQQQADLWEQEQKESAERQEGDGNNGSDEK